MTIQAEKYIELQTDKRSFNLNQKANADMKDQLKKTPVRTIFRTGLVSNVHKLRDSHFSNESRNCSGEHSMTALKFCKPLPLSNVKLGLSVSVPGPGKNNQTDGLRMQGPMRSFIVKTTFSRS